MTPSPALRPPREGAPSPAPTPQVLTALGKAWHPEHFTCARCGQELGGQPFFERGGQAYCEEDYHQAFSPRCAYCAGPIREKVLTAMDQTWHPEHFFCTHCGKVFGDDGLFWRGCGAPSPLPPSHPGIDPGTLPAGFHERKGKPYCRQDFIALFAPKCQGCERPLTDNYLSALQGVWHPECFVCADCLTGFASGSFFELEGRPYCETHFHQRQGTVCHGCGRPVTGRCVTAAGRKYHPEHFICAYCLGQLHKGSFREHIKEQFLRYVTPELVKSKQQQARAAARRRARQSSRKPRALGTRERSSSPLLPFFGRFTTRRRHPASPRGSCKSSISAETAEQGAAREVSP
uniref:Leupaxin n=1 Tax=Anas platyrhynchos platyrhynchos TaxID=8840 RepID=A0A493T3Y9_ANAPP